MKQWLSTEFCTKNRQEWEYEYSASVGGDSKQLRNALTYVINKIWNVYYAEKKKSKETICYSLPTLETHIHNYKCEHSSSGYSLISPFFTIMQQASH